MVEVVLEMCVRSVRTVKIDHVCMRGGGGEIVESDGSMSYFDLLCFLGQGRVSCV